jgi:hypothetical protein
MGVPSEEPEIIRVAACRGTWYSVLKILCRGGGGNEKYLAITAAQQGNHPGLLLP